LAIMSVKRRRAYNSPERAGQVEATRQRLLEAANRLFARDGYAAVSMTAIAREAGSSVAGAYLHFPGKPALIAAMAEAIVAAPELSVEQVERVTAPVEQLRIGARILRTLNERSWLVADILRAARGTDPPLAAVWDMWQRRHEHAVRRAVDAVAARDGLRPGLTVDDAVDSLYALSGTDTYRSLVAERGWTADRYERWLFELCCRELLGREPPAG
jgi:AcrR family transcriptional regulator